MMVPQGTCLIASEEAGAVCVRPRSFLRGLEPVKRHHSVDQVVLHYQVVLGGRVVCRVRSPRHRCRRVRTEDCRRRHRSEDRCEEDDPRKQ